MALSKELQTGKAGEHLVCFDLISKGFNAFLSDQGLPFDLILEHEGQIKRIQVKSCSFRGNGSRTKNIYKFNLRYGKHGRALVLKNEVDIYAFVALDIKQIAYFSIEMLQVNGQTRQLLELKTRSIDNPKRVYTNGTIRKGEVGRFVEDYPIEKLL